MQLFKKSATTMALLLSCVSLIVSVVTSCINHKLEKTALNLQTSSSVLFQVADGGRKYLEDKVKAKAMPEGKLKEEARMIAIGNYINVMESAVFVIDHVGTFKKYKDVLKTPINWAYWCVKHYKRDKYYNFLINFTKKHKLDEPGSDCVLDPPNVKKAPATVKSNAVDLISPPPQQPTPKIP